MQNYDNVQTETLGSDVTVIKYTLNGNYHRTDGPAVIRYYADGSFIEGYFLNGQLHREDGPAEVRYERDGITVANKKYYLYGVRLENF